MRTSQEQADFLRELAPWHGDTPAPSLADRVGSALGDDIGSNWKGAVADLLAVLGDHHVARSEPHAPTAPADQQFDAMRRNWHSPDVDELRRRIEELCVLYDWPALVATINICPRRTPTAETGGAEAAGFPISDLFNVLDLHQQSGHGFRVRGGTFLTPQRVIGARNALRLLLQVVQYVDWHSRARTHADLQHHYDFAVALGKRMQEQGRHIASESDGADLDDEPFVVGPVSFVSLNWDAIGLWVQFVANRDLNRSPAVPYVGSPARRLQVFHDLGHFVPGPRVNKSHRGSKVWQPMNASSARQLNDLDHGSDVRVRVSKYLFPHGTMWWRECPNCGQLSSYGGDEWDLRSSTVFPPPPLRAFAQGIDFASWLEHDRAKERTEREAWDRGEVDARACVHCETLTYAHHAPLVMQSNFKTPPPSFIEEIQREMRVVVQDAAHIVLMGYSLPPDDVTYRAFLAARRRREVDALVRCSVVDKVEGCEGRWLYGEEIDALERRQGKLPEGVAASRALFDKENVRLFGAGVPQVFMDGDRVTDRAVEHLLNWDPE